MCVRERERTCTSSPPPKRRMARGGTGEQSRMYTCAKCQLLHLAPNVNFFRLRASSRGCTPVSHTHSLSRTLSHTLSLTLSLSRTLTHSLTLLHGGGGHGRAVANVHLPDTTKDASVHTRTRHMPRRYKCGRAVADVDLRQMSTSSGYEVRHASARVIAHAGHD